MKKKYNSNIYNKKRLLEVTKLVSKAHYLAKHDQSFNFNIFSKKDLLNNVVKTKNNMCSWRITPILLYLGKYNNNFNFNRFTNKELLKVRDRQGVSIVYYLIKNNPNFDFNRFTDEELKRTDSGYQYTIENLIYKKKEEEKYLISETKYTDYIVSSYNLNYYYQPLRKQSLYEVLHTIKLQRKISYCREHNIDFN